MKSLERQLLTFAGKSRKPSGLVRSRSSHVMVGIARGRAPAQCRTRAQGKATVRSRALVHSQTWSVG